MSTSDTPDIIEVQVKKYEVNLTLDDLLTPLAAKAEALSADGGTPADAELAEHVQRLSDLAGQLREVAGRINALDPAMLAPTPRDASAST